MPFTSEKQRRFMFAAHPRIAKRWAHENPAGDEGLPRYAHGKTTSPALKAAWERVKERIKRNKEKTAGVFTYSKANVAKNIAADVALNHIASASYRYASGSLPGGVGTSLKDAIKPGKIVLIADAASVPLAHLAEKTRVRKNRRAAGTLAGLGAAGMGAFLLSRGNKEKKAGICSQALQQLLSLDR